MFGREVFTAALALCAPPPQRLLEMHVHPLCEDAETVCLMLVVLVRGVRHTESVPATN